MGSETSAKRKDRQRAMRLAWLSLASIVVLSLGCCCRSSQTPTSTTVRHEIVLQNTTTPGFRILPNTDTPVDPLECRVAEDCGHRDHATGAFCEHDGSCQIACEDHWGNCNNDYRDGCEAPILHPYFCPDDPELHHVDPASISFHMTQSNGDAIQYASERYGWAALEARLEELVPCYDALLTERPDADVYVGYDVSVDDHGRVVEAELREAFGPSDRIRPCVRKLLLGFDFKQPPKDFPHRFKIRFVFQPESRASEQLRD